MRAAPTGGALAPGRLAPCSWGVCKLVVTARVPCRCLKGQTVAEDCQRADAAKRWASLLNTAQACVDERSATKRMVIPTGFEPVTPRLGISCSILLSYGTIDSANDDCMNGTSPAKDRHRPSSAGRTILHQRRKMGVRTMHLYSKPTPTFSALAGIPAKVLEKIELTAPPAASLPTPFSAASQQSKVLVQRQPARLTQNGVAIRQQTAE